MTDDENSALDELPVGTLVVVGALLLAALTLPTFAPGTGPEEADPSNGTIVTPDGTTLEEVDGSDRGPLAGLNALPASHLRDEETPTVHASAGTQTMRVETTTVDGEPALNLSDDRTHGGRWVSVPTEWFERTQGEVPSVARIAHEENGTYAEPIQVRGDSAAFYVRGFSTNTVTFGGELVIQDQPAINGTRHTYQLDSRDSVDDLSINVTGVSNSQDRTISGVTQSNSIETVDIGGTTTPTNESLNLSLSASSSLMAETDFQKIYIDEGTTGSETRTLDTGGVSSVSDITLYGAVYSGPADISLTVDGQDWGSYQTAGGAGTENWQIDASGPTVSATDGTIDVTVEKTSTNGRFYMEDVSNGRHGEFVIKGWPETVSVSANGGGGSASFAETETKSIDLTESTTEMTLSSDKDFEVDYELSLTERSQTVDPVVEVNGETASYSGALADGETVSLNASASWLVDGQNNVSVRVGDGSVTTGPEPKVGVEYRHDLESPRSVQYESEALSERYNISKTYTTARENATLTVPHARTVVSMRSLEYRLNESGSYSSVPQSAANLSGTTLSVDVSALAGNPVPKGTTIEVRSVGSRVDAHNAEISVVEATPVGFDLASKIRLDSWNSDSYLGVGETPQGSLVTYGTNESWTAESDYVEISADGSQRFYAPNASSGSEVTLNTLSARVSPDRNNMRVRVPESANITNTEFVVEPASVVGDGWSAEYVAGTDGQWYAVVDDSGEELGVAQKPDPIEVSRDDVGLVSIDPTEEPNAANSGGVGGGVFATLSDGNLPALSVLFGGVGLLFVAGSRPRASRDAVDGFASSVGSAFGRLPRVGGPIGAAVESVLSGAGNAAVSVGANRILTGTLAAAVAVAAAEAGLFTIGSEAGAILSVAGIAVGSLFLLREADEFTTARWIAIVGVAGVVAIQGLGEGDLLSQFVDSDAFLIAVLIGGYAVIQLVREYRANNGPDDDRPQIVFRSDGGTDDEGSP